MRVKTFEVRDKGTFIPVIAIKTEPIDEAERYLLGRAGYGTKPEDQGRYVLLAQLVGDSEIRYDPHSWTRCGRTMGIAHEYIREHFCELENGAIVDVEFISGETEQPKLSEAVHIPW